MLYHYMQPHLVPEKALVDSVKKDWLTNSMLGPYTTMRTVEKTRIVEFETHVSRLVKAAAHVLDDVRASRDEFKRHLPPFEAQQTITSVERMRSHLLQCLREGMDHFHHVHQGSDQHDKRITVLLNWPESSPVELGFQLSAFFEILPPVPEYPVDVMVRRRPPQAKMYEAKDSKWVVQRKQLEAEKGDANEVILLNEAGYCLEGTQTNFFCVRDHTVYTASTQDVLGGTIRDIVLRGCNVLKVPAVELADHISNCKSWSGAFITSTSRLVLPIKRLVIHEDAMIPDSCGLLPPQGFVDVPQCVEVQEIREFVNKDLLSRSVDVYESTTPAKIDVTVPPADPQPPTAST